MEAEPAQGKSFGDLESKIKETPEREEENPSNVILTEKPLKPEEVLNSLTELNSDDFIFRVSMTICVRCQLTTYFQLDIEEDIPPEWSSKAEDEWVFLYFQSYLDDFDWKIVKYASESEYEKTSFVLSPGVK